jgi:hypothetical protein
MDDAESLDDDLPETDVRQTSRELIKEISTWKLEARSEDNDRYFYHVKEVSAIESGSKCYVIGRKGCGKTAISEYLGRITNAEYFADKLTFKNFPFNELYALKNDGFTRPNQYITLWKYLIYSTICKLMAKNQNIASGVRDVLEKMYGSDPVALSRRVSKWVGKEFSVGLFGSSVKISREKHDASAIDWIDRVNILEDLILQSIDDATYFIIFDELDEDYREIIEADQYEQYTSLITSLFKAVQDIKLIFRDRLKYKVFPIIFLRDDIYEIIQDSDKNKWNDYKIELNWDEQKIKGLVAFRISRALDPTTKKILDFQAAWEMLLGRTLVRMGSRQKKLVSSFEFIARSTYLRPRDFVKYLQSCAEDALENDGFIHGNTVKRVDKAFSNYLKSELNDELFAILPDISTIFDVISQLRKWLFTIKEFEQAYRAQEKRANLKQKDVGFILQILFLFSVVGNMPRTGFYVFRYTNKEVRLNFNERLVVHRGLFKSLQII